MIEPVKADCPGCGTVQTNTGQISLMLCSEPEYSYFSFVCPECQKMVHHNARRQDVDILTGKGRVIPTMWHLPKEYVEPKIGATINEEDIMNFLIDLHNVKSVAEAARGGGKI